jgi:hypothetical protein
VSSPTGYAFDRQRIVVADDESVTSGLIVSALRRDGHCVVLEPGALATDDFSALTRCHLMISSLRLEGDLRTDRLQELRQCLPSLPILYLAEANRGPADFDEVPLHLPTLRTPFTTTELGAAVRDLLPGLCTGTVRSLEASPIGASGAPVTLETQAH